jgi:2-dehydro-3-deoxyphosphogluconate aldolase/(4S)-4-hydroxy-2-oxoglutarate aldolase
VNAQDHTAQSRAAQSRAARVDALLRHAPVVPVLAVSDIDDAIPLAETLVAAGLPVLEITLRTAVALEVIRRMRTVPGAIVGAGTVLTAADLAAVEAAGAAFAISPGGTDALYTAAKNTGIPLLPGIATASELMRGLEHGWTRFKFFPAESSGGIAALKGFAGPFAPVKFCPTGGIDAAKAPAYLALPNVMTVGGSWMVPGDALDARDWSRIGALARAAAALRAAVT